jgi:hypothetical protein
VHSPARRSSSRRVDDRPTLILRRTLHRVKRCGLVYKAFKNKRSERTVALPVTLVATLHTRKMAQLGERMLADRTGRTTTTSSSPERTAA